eukprot:3464104-Pyramimonas_sp.AAC.1
MQYRPPHGREPTNRDSLETVEIEDGQQHPSALVVHLIDGVADLVHGPSNCDRAVDVANPEEPIIGAPPADQHLRPNEPAKRTIAKKADLVALCGLAARFQITQRRHIPLSPRGIPLR